MSQYFPPYRSSGRIITVELDLSSYAKKTDLKNMTHIDATSFALNSNLANLALGIARLVPVPDDLTKLRM